MSFAFVPRRVGQPSIKRTERPPVRKYDTLLSPVAAIRVDVSEVSKPALVDDSGLARLAELAQSDYAIAHDTELRDYVSASEEGYIPLAWLIHHCDAFTSLPEPPSAAELAKAIRVHSTETLEVRLSFAVPSKHVWTTLRAPSEQDAGGYEVRRVDHRDVLERTRRVEEEKWAACTVYVERMPHAHWSLAGIAKFLDGLLDSSGQVQHVRLPAHHLDRPGAIPRCKGFAFAVLASATDVDRLTAAWPWDTTNAPLDSVKGFEHEAQTVGMRCLPKRDWDLREQEYLTYRERLLAEADEGQMPVAVPILPPAPVHVVPREDVDFPQGRLVLVRGVHPRTNRTALKALFANVLQEVDAIDYVDYTKGTDRCHVRVTTSAHALALEAHFREHTVGQMEPNDFKGGPPPSGEHVLRAECVLGRTEAIYWEKVPEHIRRGVLNSAPAEVPWQAEPTMFPPDAPFPPGCLVFVRNVHPHTNRTALRGLLGRALAERGLAMETIDYVDYTKGMDSCHVRVADPAAADVLEGYFADNMLAQLAASDEQEAKPPTSTKPIVVERVQGHKEELYWEKVPEKIRRAAVDKIRIGRDTAKGPVLLKSRKRRKKA